MKQLIVLVIIATTVSPLTAKEKQSTRADIGDARRDSGGVLVHTVRSPYQKGRTKIHVLLPDKIEKGSKRLPVVYVLPVEANDGDRYGDGMKEIHKHDLHNKHGAIFVAPTFSHLPWYADHPSDKQIRQETYFVDIVVPFIEKTYPALAKREGRLLLGFSKSGWGAWSLLLRHPDVFGRAAAWDSPMMMQRLGRYGTSDIYGTQENFERYHIADLLRTSKLRDERRLILTGYGQFRRHHRQLHELMLEEEIPHTYRDGPQRKHDWHSGWVGEAVERLMASRQSQ